MQRGRHERRLADTEEKGDADLRRCFATQIFADDFYFDFICVNLPLSAFICVLYFRTQAGTRFRSGCQGLSLSLPR